jgi:predicted O-methyltransferase YrrM
MAAMKMFIKKTVFGIIDILLLPFTLLLLPFLKWIRRFGVEYFPLHRKSFLGIGVFPVRDHFYEPRFRYPATFDAGKKRELALDFQIADQLASLQTLSYQEELASLQGVNNPNFGPGDADLYYLLIRNARPARIVEIGSGYSSLIALQALNRNRAAGSVGTLFCIDPFETIVPANAAGIQFIREPVENMDLSLFESLQEKDILFIDSSHIIRPGNDVLFIYQQILPMLAKGVLIHIHDIFTPRHYRQDWLNGLFRFWNEQYLLEAFLYQNTAFIIRYSLNYLAKDYSAEVRQTLTHLEGKDEPSSFWIERCE